MVKCTFCPNLACFLGKLEAAPSSCPVKVYPEIYEQTASEYAKKGPREVMVAASYVESTGYRKWTRIEEIAEFAKFLGMKRLGVASCVGLQHEGSIVSKILDGYGFDVTHVSCKTGAFNKEDLGIPKAYKLRPESTFEAACNPVTQAEVCNRENTELNIIVGLCLGHDILFTRYSKAPSTVFIVKDRVTGNNPVAALYSSYHRMTLFKKKSLEEFVQSLYAPRK